MAKEATVRSLVNAFGKETSGRIRFRSYLQQAASLLGDEPVIAKFCTFDNGYGNVAVLTPHYVIDIEGDDGDDGDGLAFCLLRSIDDVGVFEGIVKSIPGTSESSVAVIVNPSYEPSGPWWIAESDEEKESLQSFTSRLLQSVQSLERGTS